MRWRLEEPHHIDEQVLEPGTLIGDDTAYPYRATKADPKIKRAVGDPLPPSTNMTPMDEEARDAWRKKFGDEPLNRDPYKSVPLTGAEGSPMVRGPAAHPVAEPPKPVNPKPAEPPKTGMAAEKPATTKEEPKPTPSHPATPTPKV